MSPLIILLFYLAPVVAADIIKCLESLEAGQVLS